MKWLDLKEFALSFRTSGSTRRSPLSRSASYTHFIHAFDVFLVDASTDRSKGLPASPRCASRTGSRIRRSVFAIARLVVYRPGWLLDRGKSSPLGAALAELYLSECYLQSSLDALQVHGGYGYMTEYELEREVRGAVGTRIHSGTSDLQRNIIAGFAGV